MVFVVMSSNGGLIGDLIVHSRWYPKWTNREKIEHKDGDYGDGNDDNDDGSDGRRCDEGKHRGEEKRRDEEVGGRRKPPA